ncbi:hypothetical protein [Natrarchaeobaculum aegyptiacum]|uniref:Uncharacterized protein n=1 Tax=Natrarchaeobaculum aegyptiacum TaxID=745377 RepID=A0A2Z2HTD0_9EURY|nr:hypothetical protein [Natrarchaeobaculum aegyptiacum]ARS90449.1 hypothetical protein B1756_12400 [Natrarchaeobaculum aegyptiacum]
MVLESVSAVALESPIASLLAVVGTPLLLGWTYWDAGRVEVPRRWLWVVAVPGAYVLGLGLYLFATVPTTGVIMTANTGLVLYGFERELSSGEEEEPAEPGTLPRRK